MAIEATEEIDHSEVATEKVAKEEAEVASVAEAAVEEAEVRLLKVVSLLMLSQSRNELKFLGLS